MLLAFQRAVPGGLGFDQAERLAVIAPQHVIHKALAGGVRHSGDGDFRNARRVGVPAGLAEQQVDEVVPRGRFVVVVGIGLGGVGGESGGHLGAQGLQFGIEVFAVGEHFGEPRVLVAQLGLAGAQLLQRQLGNLRDRAWQLGGVEGERIGGTRAAGVVTRQPEADMEQLGEGGARLAFAERLVAMYRLVADILEKPRLGEDGVAGDGAKARLMDQRAERVLIGRGKPLIGRVEPRYDEFQPSPRVEGGGARVGQGVALGTRGGVVNVRPFGDEEAELGHGGQSSPRKAQCWREAKRDSAFSTPDSILARVRRTQFLLWSNLACSSSGGTLIPIFASSVICK